MEELERPKGIPKLQPELKLKIMLNLAQGIIDRKTREDTLKDIIKKIKENIKYDSEMLDIFENDLFFTGHLINILHNKFTKLGRKYLAELLNTKAANEWLKFHYRDIPRELKSKIMLYLSENILTSRWTSIYSYIDAIKNSILFDKEARNIFENDIVFMQKLIQLIQKQLPAANLATIAALLDTKSAIELLKQQYQENPKLSNEHFKFLLEQEFYEKVSRYPNKYSSSYFKERILPVLLETMDLNFVDNLGYTPLLLTIKDKKINILKAILEFAEKKLSAEELIKFIKAQTRYETTLILAVTDNYLYLTELLLKFASKHLSPEELTDYVNYSNPTRGVRSALEWAYIRKFQAMTLNRKHYGKADNDINRASKIIELLKKYGAKDISEERQEELDDLYGREPKSCEEESEEEDWIRREY